MKMRKPFVPILLCNLFLFDRIDELFREIKVDDIDVRCMQTEGIQFFENLKEKILLDRMIVRII